MTPTLNPAPPGAEWTAREIAQQHKRRLLRVSTPPTFLVFWILPRLHLLTDACPEIADRNLLLRCQRCTVRLRGHHFRLTRWPRPQVKNIAIGHQIVNRRIVREVGHREVENELLAAHQSILGKSAVAS